MTKKQNNKTNYEFLDVNLLETIMNNNDYPALIRFVYDLESKSYNLPYHREFKLREERHDCHTAVLNYILSLKDDKLINELIHSLFDNADLFPEVYEKACTKLIENKTPEEIMELYKLIKNKYFYRPSHTILKHISSNTKKANTCLYFIKELEEEYKKYGVKEYDEYILDFYRRFRAVCTPEEYEHFVDFGFEGEANPQKQ